MDYKINYKALFLCGALSISLGLLAAQPLFAKDCPTVCKKVYDCTLLFQSGNAANTNRLKRNKNKVLKNCVKGCKKNAGAAVACYKKSGAGVNVNTCKSIASCMLPYLQK